MTNDDGVIALPKNRFRHTSDKGMPPSMPDVTFLVFHRLYSRKTDHYADPFQMSIAEFSLETSTIGYLLRNV